MNLSEINKDCISKRYTIEAEIINVIQTKGPTLFKISDGHGTLTVKAFTGAGKRAYPEFDIGSVASITFAVTEHNGNIEGEGIQFTKISDEAKVRATIEGILKKKSQVDPVEFLVQSPVTEKLRDRFMDAARIIKQAIIKGRPILIRHHNDCDGYSSGVVLQRAILPLMQKQHGMKDATRYLTRSPCRSPFYNYEDSLRDVSIAAGNLTRFDEEPPLVIIADNGAGSEDLLGIQQGKIYGLDFIVIDHHPYGEEDVISKEVLVNINPYLVGEDYRFTAGMLCTEMAHILNPSVKNITFIAAMAGMSDRTAGAEIDQFIALAQQEGYSKDQLEKMAFVIDFIAYNLRNMEAREVVADMFGEDKDKQTKMTELLYPVTKKLFDNNLALAKAFGKKEMVGQTLVQFLDIENTFSRSSYPPAGKTNGLLHDLAKLEHAKVVTYGFGSDFVTIRASDDAPFELHDVLERMKQELPQSFAEGGGHQKAGSIKFAPAAQAEVLAFLKKVIAEKQ